MKRVNIVRCGHRDIKAFKPLQVGADSRGHKGARLILGSNNKLAHPPLDVGAHLWEIVDSPLTDINEYPILSVLFLSIAVISGGSRIFQKKVCQLIIWHIYYQRLHMKMKTIGPRGGTSPLRPPWIHQCRSKSHLNALWRYQFKPSIEYSYEILQTVSFSMNRVIFMNTFPETSTSNNGWKNVLSTEDVFMISVFSDSVRSVGSKYEFKNTCVFY